MSQALTLSWSNFRLAAVNWRHAPVQAGVVLTFLLLPLWYRFPGSPRDFDRFYPTGFVLFWPMLATVAAWLLLGLPGFAALRRDPLRRAWALTLLLLALWALLSWSWAYVRPHYPDATASAALQFALALLFALAAACAGPPPRLIAAALLVGLAWNSAVAGLQVAQQESIGLLALGEYTINPVASGVSVVQADGVRWLRPYGLMPHPNMLAGILVVGLLAGLTWVFAPRPALRWAGSLLMLAGLWALLLTFSRGAWIGLAAGLVAALPLVWSRIRAPVAATLGRQARLLALLTLLLGGLFMALYGPFLAARAGVGDESVELRSVSDRVIYTGFAYRAISEAPLIGLGIGNFPWRAQAYLRFTDFDLRGQPAHHVFLSAWAELGLVGLGLTALTLILGVEAGLRAIRRSGAGRESFARIGLLAGVIALAIIGLVDHYPWTLLQFQALWWGALGLCAAPQPEESPQT